MRYNCHPNLPRDAKAQGITTQIRRASAVFEADIEAQPFQSEEHSIKMPDEDWIKSPS
jgi:hypothetical protein